jgi:hypothetical protein
VRLWDFVVIPIEISRSVRKLFNLIARVRTGPSPENRQSTKSSAIDSVTSQPDLVYHGGTNLVAKSRDVTLIVERRGPRFRRLRRTDKTQALLTRFCLTYKFDSSLYKKPTSLKLSHASPIKTGTVHSRQLSQCRNLAQNRPFRKLMSIHRGESRVPPMFLRGARLQAEGASELPKVCAWALI